MLGNLVHSRKEETSENLSKGVKEYTSCLDRIFLLQDIINDYFIKFSEIKLNLLPAIRNFLLDSHKQEVNILKQQIVINDKQVTVVDFLVDCFGIFLEADASSFVINFQGNLESRDIGQIFSVLFSLKSDCENDGLFFEVESTDSTIKLIFPEA